MEVSGDFTQDSGNPLSLTGRSLTGALGLMTTLGFKLLLLLP